MQHNLNVCKGALGGTINSCDVLIFFLNGGALFDCWSIVWMCLDVCGCLHVC